MRGTLGSIEDYVLEVAAFAERLGVTIRGGDEVPILEDRDGALSFELAGDLPDGLDPSRAGIVIREGFDSVGPEYVRSRYEYELIDHSLDLRRAFHLHHPDWFERRFLVVVHEHCERPIGTVDCEHYQGLPIRDAFAGIMALIDAWTSDAPDCTELRCLE